MKVVVRSRRVLCRLIRPARDRHQPILDSIPANIGMILRRISPNFRSEFLFLWPFNGQRNPGIVVIEIDRCQCTDASAALLFFTDGNDDLEKRNGRGPF